MPGAGNKSSRCPFFIHRASNIAKRTTRTRIRFQNQNKIEPRTTRRQRLQNNTDDDSKTNSASTSTNSCQYPDRAPRQRRTKLQNEHQQKQGQLAKAGPASSRIRISQKRPWVCGLQAHPALSGSHSLAPRADRPINSTIHLLRAHTRARAATHPPVSPPSSQHPLAPHASLPTHQSPSLRLPGPITGPLLAV